MRRWGRRRKSIEIHPDEILIDSENLPGYERDRFEGRIERPIGRNSFFLTGLVLCFIFLAFAARAGNLQILKGEEYATQARENQLAEDIIFADRGTIVDRKGEVLAGNVRESVEDDFAKRTYTKTRGLAHVLGYVQSPAKDSSGFYFRESFTGVDGVERAYDAVLAGRNGTDLTETNAKGEMVSRAVIRPAAHGVTLELSVDAQLNQELYDALETRMRESKFQGGAAVVMDVRNGEILGFTSVPEYSAQAVVEGNAQLLGSYQSDPSEPFLNRVTAGLYAPGSIVKPFVATGALTEGVIDEFKKIVSTGSITIPNPYDPSNPSIYRDWKAHGAVDMRQALAFSSDVYFYEVGGGFQDQRGLGIARLEEYFRLFGFGAPTGILGFHEEEGTIPNPQWKEATFNGDPWRLGNTYHTAIGQYGMQVTPLQAVRAVAAIANGGRLLTPTFIKNAAPKAQSLGLDPHVLQVVQEGMHLAVEQGTALALNTSYVSMAGKTGTAQLGSANQYMNSWVMGFFPYENPRYAFAMVLEKAPAGTLMGSPAAMRVVLDWMAAHTREYFAN